jgi:GxxExxY protein
MQNINFIYEELSYKLIGALYDVYNNLGPGLKEKTYKDALVMAFKKIQISFQREWCVNISYSGIIIGKRFFDFFIDEKIVLEIKIGNYYAPQHMKQTNDYLRIAKLKLAILAYFGSDRVRIKRLVNLY